MLLGKRLKHGYNSLGYRLKHSFSFDATRKETPFIKRCGHFMDSIAKGLTFIIVLYPEDAARKQTQAWVQTHSERDSNGGR